jgi:isoleucyl-tRNA synthetase
MTAASVRHIADVISRHPRGSDAWWSEPVSTFIPDGLCGPEVAATCTKGTETLDVWMDSGCSWAAAWAAADAAAAAHAQLKNEAGEPLGGKEKDATAASGSLRGALQADIVLEGSDQHRGWFQSSLITAVAATGRAPYRHVVTHGFVLDEQGRKMSKSLGNVLTPADLLEGRASSAAASSSKQQARGSNKGGSAGAESTALGADVLRWWVASCDYASDSSVGPTILSKVTESVRKIRNTLRFILGALHGWKGEDGQSSEHEALLRVWAAPVPRLLHSPRVEQLSLLDRAMLHRLAVFQRDVCASYDSLVRYSRR